MLKIGSRVLTRKSAHDFDGLTGIILGHTSHSDLYAVRLDRVVTAVGRTSTDWNFASYQLKILTHEEEIQLADQERRKQHADKYL